MARAVQPAPDGHSRPCQTIANRHFVFVPVTQQRGMTICHSQFPRHGGDGEQRRQTFYPLPPIKMSRGGHAGELELITRHLPVFFRHSHRKSQMLIGLRFTALSRKTSTAPRSSLSLTFFFPY